MRTSVRVLDRIAGEAKIVVVHDGEKIVDGYVVLSAPVRGFERLVLGKNLYFTVNALMRICGVCHAAHGIASAEALEDALSIVPPIQGRRLREAIGLINRVQSHLLHLALVARDIASVGLEWVKKRIIPVLESVNQALARIGGSPTHPSRIVVGGVHPPPKEAAVREAVRRLREARKNLEQVVDEVLSSVNDLGEELDRIKLPSSIGLLATHPFYGDKYSIDLDRVRVVRYDEYRGDRSKLTSSVKPLALVALYADSVVEVGPRARLKRFAGFRGDSLLKLQEARMIETLYSIDRVIEVLESLHLNSPLRSPIMVLRSGEGVGVYEAPRGTLIHVASIDSDGRVSSYRIIVPTMFNILVVEECLRGAPVRLADLIVRVYDPCIPCALHYVRC